MIRIGVLGTANIAERRMIPAIKKNKKFEYVGVAIATKEETDPICTMEAFTPRWQKRVLKAQDFVTRFGGDISEGFTAMLEREDVDAVYIPLPPALHAYWIEKALQYGKHVIAEKPITTSLKDTERIIAEARKRKLAIIENYGFVYHKQMNLIRKIISEGKIGEIRLIRAAFGFPHRAENDFRYVKALGGGALLDCGGYTLKAASVFLGEDIEVMCSHLATTLGHEVDIFGCVNVKNKQGICAQLSFGMDNAYKCELEIWGSKGIITAPRVFTAPAEYETLISIICNNEKEQFYVSDDQFESLLDVFHSHYSDSKKHELLYKELHQQSRLVDLCK